MLKEKTIKLQLVELGYSRVRRLAYQATWSTPAVEQFLFFSLYGKPKEFLTGEFGFRNTEAQDFGVRCVQTYGSEIYSLLEQEKNIKCYMRFSLGGVAGWSPRGSLDVRSVSEEELAATIKAAVHDKLFPLVRSVTTLDRLLTLLIRDEEPVRWLHVNGAMRAAQIAFLARTFGMSRADVLSILAPHAKAIGTNLVRAKVDIATYIERVIDDSEEAVQSTA
jgi:hypothetical protein